MKVGAAVRTSAFRLAWKSLMKNGGSQFLLVGGVAVVATAAVVTIGRDDNHSLMQEAKRWLDWFVETALQLKMGLSGGVDDVIQKDSLPASAHETLIGNTPIVCLERLSRLVGRSIFVKMESLNPSGTGKDRAALAMVQEAERRGLLPAGTRTVDHKLFNGKSVASKLESSASTMSSNERISGTSDENELDVLIGHAMKHSRTGGLIVEGTSGSTGIALAALHAGRGHACLVIMPDDQADEKIKLLQDMGATVHVVPVVGIASPRHYVNIARRVAARARQVHNVAAHFCDQFANPANFRIHYTTTGPEILNEMNNFVKQCRLTRGQPACDAFCMSAGTGGTISGVGRYLKESLSNCKVVLVDPPGSVLFNKITHGVAYTSQQREQSLKRHRYDTLAEGIGMDRVTGNVTLGLDWIDSAVTVSDQEAVDMAHWLRQHEGLWVGSSSAMNIVGAVLTAIDLRQGSRVVTLVCDHGSRHQTRFWNRNFCLNWGLQWPGDCDENKSARIPECLRLVEVPTDVPVKEHRTAQVSWLRCTESESSPY